MLAIKPRGLDHFVLMMSCARYGDHPLEPGIGFVEKRRTSFGGSPMQTGEPFARCSRDTCRDFHDDDIAFGENAAGRAGIAEDQRGIFHRRRANDPEVDIASALEDGARGRRFELIFGDARSTSASASIAA